MNQSTEKAARGAISITNKVDFRNRSYPAHKERDFILIKGILQEDIRILVVQMSDNRTSKGMNETLLELKGGQKGISIAMHPSSQCWSMIRT